MRSFRVKEKQVFASFFDTLIPMKNFRFGKISEIIFKRKLYITLSLNTIEHPTGSPFRIFSITLGFLDLTKNPGLVVINSRDSKANAIFLISEFLHPKFKIIFFNRGISFKQV